MRRILIALLSTATLSGGAYMARYDYVTVDNQALRVNRFTGQTEVLRAGEGWRPIKTRSTAAPVDLTPAERAYLETGQR